MTSEQTFPGVRPPLVRRRSACSDITEAAPHAAGSGGSEERDAGSLTVSMVQLSGCTDERYQDPSAKPGRYPYQCTLHASEGSFL
jgi:hypothetical protein